jgi:hypothetical protein
MPMVDWEFLAELQEVRGSFHWKLVVSDRFPERRVQPRSRVRAAIKAGPKNVLLDPIGALCYARTGQIHPPEAWVDAANAVGLSLIDAADLTAAANDRTWLQVEGRREPDPCIPALRRRLAAAVGLDLNVGFRVRLNTMMSRLLTLGDDDTASPGAGA